MKSLKLNGQFNLESTLFCGQAFRWERQGDWFYGVIGDGILKLKQENSTIYYDSSNNITNDTLIRYLSLDLELNSVLNKIDRDKNIHSAIDFCRGLRLLRQEPWETFATYILSSYSNIPRIRRMVFNISRRFGKRLIFNGYVNYTFPEIERIAGAREKELKALGLGFRAGYLKNTAKRILNEGDLFLKLRLLSYEEIKKKLLQFEGVGDKVADCTMLFGLSRLEAFPVDVWIKRGIERLYFKGKPLSPKKINEFGRKYFGEYAGYAQEYLYHYLRNKI